MDRLYKNVMDVNPQFVDDLLLEKLLTTEVENLHAVSHFKLETFTVLTYAHGTVPVEINFVYLKEGIDEGSSISFTPKN